MTNQEIENLKSLLRRQGGDICIDSMTGGITEEGFLFLMRMFVMKDRAETVWMTLRRLHYEDDISLPEAIVPVDVMPGQSVEFTTEGRVFLTTVTSDPFSHRSSSNPSTHRKPVF